MLTQKTRARADTPALAWFFLVAVGAGCAVIESAPPAPVDGAIVSAAQSRGWDEASLRRGHDLFAWHCARCHRPAAPWALTEPEWDEILPRMYKKSGLDKDEAGDVRSYILAVRASRPTLPAK